MADFDVEMVGDTPGDIQDRLTGISLSARNRTNRALMKTAREVKDDLEKTSPYDTGDYMDAWYVWPAKTNEVWILNEVEHAKYVMLPNSVMIGSSKADIPSMGLLHNVKGVARGHGSNLKMNMAEELSDMIQSFRV